MLRVFLWVKFMKYKTYYEKLKDPRWQKKRLEVMQIKDFCCEICGESEKPLNVHHKEYFKNKEPWDYSFLQLAVLCEDCHKIEHENIDLLKTVVSLLDLDGPLCRTEIAFIVGGIHGIEYELLRDLYGQDLELYKSLHNDGMKIKSTYFKKLRNIVKRIKESI